MAQRCTLSAKSYADSPNFCESASNMILLDIVDLPKR